MISGCDDGARRQNAEPELRSCTEHGTTTNFRDTVVLILGFLRSRLWMPAIQRQAQFPRRVGKGGMDDGFFSAQSKPRCGVPPTAEDGQHETRWRKVCPPNPRAVWSAEGDRDDGGACRRGKGGRRHLGLGEAPVLGRIANDEGSHFLTCQPAKIEKDHEQLPVPQPVPQPVVGGCP